MSSREGETYQLRWTTKIYGTGFCFGSSPKSNQFNQLVPGARFTRPKNFVKIRSYIGRCQFTPCLLMVQNHKNDPRKNPMWQAILTSYDNYPGVAS